MPFPSLHRRERLGLVAAQQSTRRILLELGVVSRCERIVKRSICYRRMRIGTRAAGSRNILLELDLAQVNRLDHEGHE